MTAARNDMGAGLRTLIGVLAILLLACAGCARSVREDFTEVDQRTAEVSGFPDVRVWGDETFDAITRLGLAPKPRRDKPIQLLAISGGGSAGAFGAGALVGLSEAGARPDFDIVSGVSTGALTAPFAFLGADYDDELTYIYTSGVTERLFGTRPLIAGLLGSSLVSAGPLRALVEEYVDKALLDAVAAEHREGRRLVVVTTNMDAQRPVLWDLGRIAASGRPDALDLFRDVLVASASVPGVLPPVLIDAQVNGRRIREMHSDGGTAVQVFAIPDGVLATASSRLLPPNAEQSELYMLVNYTLVPEFEITPDSTLGIGVRGLFTLMKAQTRNSVIATYGFARQAGMAFRIASIDTVVPYDPTDAFDPGYMRTLFALGHDRALSKQLWRSDPARDLSASLSSTATLAASRR